MLRRRKALLFTDVARLADYVCLGYPDAAAPVLGYTLYQVPAPHNPRQTLLLLLGHHPRRWRLLDRLSTFFAGTAFDDIYEEVLVLEEVEHPQDHPPSHLRLIRSGQESAPLPIRAHRRSPRLIELVELVPLPGGAAAGPAPGSVLFLTEDPRRLGRLIVDSLALGNDRIRLAGVGSRVLARVEQPSWFLLDRFREEEPGVLLFTPLPEAGGRVWLPWGWSHPLAALWGQSSATAAATAWLLFLPGNERLRLDPAPAWEDVYDVSDVPLDFAATTTAVVPAPVSTRFTVPVRLAPRARPIPPELWLLEEAERPALEAMLRSLDEADLNEILVAVVQPEAGGPCRYLLRERRTGEGARRLLDLDARGFAPWQGIVDLFLPADLALEPRLRRDRYRAMLQLGSGQLTLLAPSTQDTSAPIEILHVPLAAFAPLSELVDFLLTAAAPRIEAIRARDLFAFGAYTRAPARPDLLQAPRPLRTAADAPAAGTAPPAAPTEARDASAHRSPPSRAAAVPSPPAERPSALQEEEQALERALILAPDAARWTRLGELKQALGQPDDAVACVVEAAWLADARDEADAHAALLAAIAQQLSLHGSLSQRLREILRHEGPPGAVAYALHGHGLPSGQVAGWLEVAERLLRAQEGFLPKKLRWLAWGAVWRHNRDTRNQARVREQILARLDADGVLHTDIPRFILARLLADRTLAGQIDTEASEIGRAQASLQGVRSALLHFTPPLRHGGLAAVAHALHHIGRVDQSGAAFAEARQGLSQPLTAAWVTLLAADAMAPHAPSAAEALQQAFQQQLGAVEVAFHSDLRDRQAALTARRRDQAAETFLTTDNLARLFPDIAGARTPGLDAELSQLQHLRRENRQRKFNEAAERFLQRLRTERVDPRALARVLFLAVRELAAMEKADKDSPLPELFERFAEDMGQRASSGQGSSGGDDYFTILTLSSLARGLAELKRPAATLRFLRRGIEQMAAMSTDPLDVIDVGSTLLRGIELLPLDQRAPLLRSFLEALNQQLLRLHRAITTPILLSALDLLLQTCTTAVSKDQLTLTLYRQYQDLDELLIRERVLREDFCL